MKCRHCKTSLELTFADLGFAPPSNAYLNSDQLNAPEQYFPLKVMVCSECWLVQTIDYTSAGELFTNEYAYFSSTSKSWLKHSEKYAQMIIEKLHLNQDSFVVEVASNDGYLLKNFLDQNIPCLGIEPTLSTAKAAEKLEIPVIKKFFSEELAKKLVSTRKKADLIIGNNVYAHVPDINDFTLGLKHLLSRDGSITLEFPHVLNLIEHNQFDTIYHEHFSYLSLGTVCKIFERANLRIYDVEKLSTHGGSLRVYGCHEDDPREVQDNVTYICAREQNIGINHPEIYSKFQQNIENIKNNFLKFLIEQKELGKTTMGYGAAAKGNTLLNFAGIKSDLISAVCDAAEAKQGNYLPGSHLPILTPEAINEIKPDNILILPWNLKAEVISILDQNIDWNCNFVTAIPDLQIVNNIITENER
ncbi:class I SAM-dependent methyltransferase [Amylibacter sp.]|nr:class I SAM-dependent methyltransferase [Amylibacter sp.]